MLCPDCGYENLSGIRFCEQCAVQLNLECPHCGFGNPADFQFCGKCATPLIVQIDMDADIPIPAQAVRDLADKLLVSRGGLEGERRNLTVVFVDLSSFTHQAEKLDPEDVYVAVAEYLQALVEQVHRFGGHVDKFTGDGIMALFGAPIAHENDPERALRASLGMQEVLRELETKSDGSMPISLKARIGVNSGTAVVGTVGSESSMDFTAMGDVVNVAARLEKMAEPGTVLVSQSTYEETQHQFRFQSVGSLMVKGRREPVEAYSLESESALSGNLEEKVKPPSMVGRRDELRQLEEPVRRLIEDGEGGLVLITGEAGIGKSCLVEEFCTALPTDSVAAHYGVTTSYSTPGPYEVFVRLLQSFFNLKETDPPEEVLQKILSRLDKIDIDLKRVTQPYLSYLMDMNYGQSPDLQYLNRDPKTLRQNIFLAVRELLSAAAVEQPLIFIFEDLQWIDELSLELILFLLSGLNHVPLLILTTTRMTDDAAPKRLDEISREKLAEYYLRIDLLPLSQEENATLIRSLLNLSTLPTSLEKLIKDKAEGNPFFTIQLFEALVDGGLVTKDQNGWLISPTIDLAEFNIPKTLDGLIMSRFDSLGASGKHVLHLASVLGRRFSHGMLAGLLDDEAVELEDELKMLLKRNFISVTQRESKRVFEFQHGLMRDCVYNSLLIRRRKIIHSQAAIVMEELEPELVRIKPELIAHHYSNSDSPVRAIPHLIVAGDLGRQRFANKEAIGFYEQARTWIESAGEGLSEPQIQILVGLGGAYTITGDYHAAVDAYVSALSLLAMPEIETSLEQEAIIQGQLGRVFERLGDYVNCESLLMAALENLDAADVPPDSTSRANIFSELGWLYFRQGKYDEALQWILMAIPIMEDLSCEMELASAYNRLVAIYYNQGKLEEAAALGEKSLDLRREIGDLSGIANSNNNLGALEINLGNWDQASIHLMQGFDLYEKLGYIEGMISAQSNLAFIHMGRGDLILAEKMLTTALDLAKDTDNAWLVAGILHQLGEHSILGGDPSTALEHLQRSRSIANESGAREVEAEAAWRMAWAYKNLGEIDEAEYWVSESIKISEDTGSKEILGNSLRIQGMLHQQAGRINQAIESFQSSIEVLQSLGNRYETARSQLQAGHSYMILADTGEAVESEILAAGMFEKAALRFRELGASPDMETAEKLLRSIHSKAEIEHIQV